MSEQNKTEDEQIRNEQKYEYPYTGWIQPTPLIFLRTNEEWKKFFKNK